MEKDPGNKIPEEIIADNLDVLDMESVQPQYDDELKEPFVDSNGILLSIDEQIEMSYVDFEMRKRGAGKGVDIEIE